MEVVHKGFSRISKACEGFSLIEVLIVVVIFAIIGVLMSQTIILTLQTTKRSDTTTRVRQNVDFALAGIGRLLQNAGSITSTCLGTPSAQIDYTDLDGNAGSFSCVNVGPDGYVASSGAQITGSDIAITKCSFTCTQTSGAPYVDILIGGSSKTATGLQNATVSAGTKIYLRTY